MPLKGTNHGSSKPSSQPFSPSKRANVWADDCLQTTRGSSQEQKAKILAHHALGVFQMTLPLTPRQSAPPSPTDYVNERSPNICRQALKPVSTPRPLKPSGKQREHSWGFHGHCERATCPGKPSPRMILQIDLNPISFVKVLTSRSLLERTVKLSLEPNICNGQRGER